MHIMTSYLLNSFFCESVMPSSATLRGLSVMSWSRRIRAMSGRHKGASSEDRLNATPTRRDRRSADQPDCAVAQLDRECLSDRSPFVAFAAPASGFNASRGPRTSAPVRMSYNPACHGHCKHPSSVRCPSPSEANMWRQQLETANGLPALIPTAKVPWGLVSTTATCEAPRCSTAMRRVSDSSKVVIRGLGVVDQQEVPSSRREANPSGRHAHRHKTRHAP